MSNSITSKWQSVCERVSSYDDVDGVQFSALMERVVPQAFSDGFLLVTADNAFLKSWIEKNFLSNIQRALQDIYNIPFTVVIEVDEGISGTETKTGDVAPAFSSEQTSSASTSTSASTPQQQSSSNATTSASAQSAAQNITADTSSPTSQEGSAGGETTPIQSAFKTLTFENFVRGESNRMAYSMAVQVAESPGEKILNPLFIYGKSGLGKTHLMRAIQNYINKTQPQLNTVYEDTDNFVSGYVNAAIDHTREKDSYQTFMRTYEDADVLLIDDVQFLQNKEGTIDIIFQIFNRLINEGKQIVLSADRAPKNIDIDERYTSRFAQGGTIDIKPPEVETKLAIVKSFINELSSAENTSDVEVPENIQVYIAENSGSNIRELKSAITHLVMYINMLDHKDVKLEEVKGLLEGHFSRGMGRNLTIEDIQKEVESFYRVKHTDLISQSRSHDIVIPRQIAMYLCRQLLDDPLETIGNKFNRDHSTVMHSVRKIEKDIFNNRNLQEEVEAIKKKINEI